VHYNLSQRLISQTCPLTGQQTKKGKGAKYLRKSAAAHLQCNDTLSDDFLAVKSHSKRIIKIGANNHARAMPLRDIYILIVVKIW